MAWFFYFSSFSLVIWVSTSVDSKNLSSDSKEATLSLINALSLSIIEISLMFYPSNSWIVFKPIFFKNYLNSLISVSEIYFCKEVISEWSFSFCWDNLWISSSFFFKFSLIRSMLICLEVEASLKFEILSVKTLISESSWIFCHFNMLF